MKDLKDALLCSVLVSMLSGVAPPCLGGGLEDQASELGGVVAADRGHRCGHGPLLQRGRGAQRSQLPSSATPMAHYLERVYFG